jgi:YebC/PmpR family DNA-binding regulatory protein
MGAQWKHKGRQDAANAKGRVFSKLAKEIMIAARGGPDPESNSQLRAAIESAKKASMPRETLDRAIKKGAGLTDDAVHFDTVTYEGFAPHRVPVIVECLTDNKNRTAPNIRVLFRKGQLATSGAVSWDFAHVGLIDAAASAHAPDAETAAIEAGAQDFESDAAEGSTRFYTEPADLDTVSRALAGLKWTVHSMRLGWRAKNPVKISDPTALAEVEAFLGALDEDEDVQHLYVGLES